MRVLFTTRPLTGHYYPMRPLMAALTAARAQVAVATAEPVATSARDDGFSVHRARMDDDDPAILHNRRILPRQQIFRSRVMAVACWPIVPCVELSRRVLRSSSRCRRSTDDASTARSALGLRRKA